MLLKIWRFATFALVLMLAAVSVGHAWTWPGGWSPASFSPWMPSGLAVPAFEPALLIAWGSAAAAVVLVWLTRTRGISQFFTGCAALALLGFCATRWLGFQSVDLGFTTESVAGAAAGWQSRVFEALTIAKAEFLCPLAALAALQLSILVETPVEFNAAAFLPTERLRRMWSGWTGAEEDDELTFEEWYARVFDQRWRVMREAS